MTAHELKAICDACKQPVDDRDGCIWIDNGMINERQESVRAWEKEGMDRTPAGELVIRNAMEIMNYPGGVRWNVHHSACDLDIDADAYSIEVERLRSWADLAHWTAHLMGKAWLGDTDWRKVLDSAAHGEGTRITPVAAPRLHH
ncbi:hypothetical protein ACFYWY_04025 [Streptomyces sp. NPDC002870]|uniref:hypothetical protein n=1 Tax=Streptomyces sp. NPDC002870 TaxID=3364666 RepID=UPI003678743A